MQAQFANRATSVLVVRLQVQVVVPLQQVSALYLAHPPIVHILDFMTRAVLVLVIQIAWKTIA